MTAALRPRALAVLRAGRLTVLHAECRKLSYVVDEVIARVQSVRQGHHSAWTVDLLDGCWTCTCAASGRCPHVAAVQMVTGHAALVDPCPRAGDDACTDLTPCRACRTGVAS